MRDNREKRVPIDSERDIVAVRKMVRETATALGFSITDVTRIVTAASELARNIFHYAGDGSMVLRIDNQSQQPLIELIFTDSGPGIPDVDQAMQMGYTSRGGLGLGLPGAKRLMDELDVQTQVGQGTTVTARKYLKR